MGPDRPAQMRSLTPQQRGAMKGALRAALRWAARLACIALVAGAFSWWAATVWLAPRCQAYAAAQGRIYAGLSFDISRRGSARIAPCLFLDSTGRPQADTRWSRLDAGFLTSFVVRPDLMAYLFGGVLVALWLLVSRLRR